MPAELLASVQSLGERLCDLQAQHQRLVEAALDEHRRRLEAAAGLPTVGGAAPFCSSVRIEAPSHGMAAPLGGMMTTAAAPRRNGSELCTAALQEEEEEDEEEEPAQTRAGLSLQDVTADVDGLSEQPLSPVPVAAGRAPLDKSCRQITPVSDFVISHHCPGRPSVQSRQTTLSRHTVEIRVRERINSVQTDLFKHSWNDSLEERSRLQHASPRSSDVPLLRRIVASKAYETTVMALIGLNTLFIGVQVQAAARSLPSSVYTEPHLLTLLEYLFVIVFTGDLVLRLLVFGCSMYKSIDARWHIFDTAIVVMMLLEQVEKHFLTDDFPLSQAASFRMLRAIRIIRAIRMLHLMRFLQELRVLMTMVMISVKSMVWTGFVILGLVYVFGVILAQGLLDFCSNRGGCEEPEFDGLLLRFGGIDASLFSLFLVMTNGVDWEDIYHTLAPLPEFYSSLFICYIGIACFAILNIVTGIFVETAVHVTGKDRDAVVVEEIKRKEDFLEKIRSVFKEMDTDNSNEVTFEEINAALMDPRLLAYFNALELDFSDVTTLFVLLDRNQKGSIDLSEFLRGCMRLRGEARTFDLAKLQYQSEWVMHNLNLVLEELIHIQGAMEGITEEELQATTCSRRISNRVKPDYCFAPPEKQQPAQSPQRQMLRL